MIDLAQAEADCAQAGISLRDSFELKVHAFGNVDFFGDLRIEDKNEQEFRGRVAQVLIDHDLHQKARRYLECLRYGIRLQCEGPQQHALFAVVHCDLRFCPCCGPRQFARLIEKYSPVLRSVSGQRRRGYALREITLTCRKSASLTSAQVKKFNEDVKKALKVVAADAEDWGAIWCDEVGFNNTNLHAHILFYGPYVEQSRLAEVWRAISGHQVVFITKAHVNGPKALIHLLKYVSKPPSDDPEIIGQLEVAFHGRRRVHALGVFYNFASDDSHDHQPNPWKSCPHCGAGLTRQPGTVRLENLVMEERTFIGTRRPEGEKRAWVN